MNKLLLTFALILFVSQASASECTLSSALKCSEAVTSAFQECRTHQFDFQGISACVKDGLEVTKNEECLSCFCEFIGGPACEGQENTQLEQSQNDTCQTCKDRIYQRPEQYDQTWYDTTLNCIEDNCDCHYLQEKAKYCVYCSEKLRNGPAFDKKVWAESVNSCFKSFCYCQAF